MAIINIRRAYETIFYEEILTAISNTQVGSQQTLYPIQLSLTHKQLQNFFTLKKQLEGTGYKFERISQNAFNIVGIPPFMEANQAYNVLIDILNDPDTETIDVYQLTMENLAAIMARSKARTQDTNLNEVEMETVVNKLFASYSPNISPFGKKNFYILKLEEIDKFFK